MTTIRLDDEMFATVQREAERRGLSMSEFIRQAITMQIAWDRALRTVKAGADPATLGDFDRLAELLAKVAKR